MENRIEKHIELKAPISKVWRSLTDHREFGEWFGVKLESPFTPGQTSRGQITHPLLTIIESGFDRIPRNRRDEAFRMNEDGWTAQIENIEKYVTRKS